MRQRHNVLVCQSSPDVESRSGSARIQDLEAERVVHLLGALGVDGLGSKVCEVTPGAKSGPLNPAGPNPTTIMAAMRAA